MFSLFRVVCELDRERIKDLTYADGTLKVCNTRRFVLRHLGQTKNKTSRGAEATHDDYQQWRWQPACG